jgi:fructose/tagatose bisphosphate aldolase
VFDYNTHEQLYKDLRAMFDPTAAALAAEQAAAAVAAAAGTPHAIAKEAPTEVKAKVLSSSKKAKKATAAV